MADALPVYSRAMPLVLRCGPRSLISLLVLVFSYAKNLAASGAGLRSG